MHSLSSAVRAEAATHVDAATNVGLFGKTPHVGDFVERRIHPAFHSLWDEWLQGGIAASQRVLGDAWLDIYLTSPVWRFAFSAGVCGDAVYAGVLVPSVDRVGRYFPLSIVASLPAGASCVRLLTAGDAWFGAAEAILIRVLDGRITDVDEFDREVNALAVPLAELRERAGDTPSLNTTADIVLPLQDARELAPRLSDLAESLLAQRRTVPQTYWLTQGSRRVSPRFLAITGLPPTTLFTPLLNGEFTPLEWQHIPFRSASQPLPDATVATRIPCSIRTERGHVRDTNEDAAVARPDLGMWVVADGMGGYADGAFASAAVCAALEAVAWTGDLASRVTLATEALRAVNADLRPRGDPAPRQINSASTVLIFLIRKDDWACIWSGDSRLYRMTNGSLEQISVDHAIDERLTAGVGVKDELHFDVAYGKVNPADRFLLCTDGVHHALDEQQITQALAATDPARAAHALIAAVLAGRAIDNATAITVYVP
jgi:type VI secretion system protein ImpM